MLCFRFRTLRIFWDNKKNGQFWLYFSQFSKNFYYRIWSNLFEPKTQFCHFSHFFVIFLGGG